MAELKPCRHCGGISLRLVHDAVVLEDGTSRCWEQVECQQCHARGPRVYVSKKNVEAARESASRLWNGVD